MAEFQTVGKASEIADGEVRAFDVGDRAVAVAQSAGNWYAFDDTCTHLGCSLADGEVDGTMIICSCHGSEFDMESGEVIQGPATDPVDTFDVQVEGDDIQVAV